MTSSTVRQAWIELQPTKAFTLIDARLQAHYAAQFATAIGISYLGPRPDDSHTNLGWDFRHQALKSRETRALSHGVRVAMRPQDLTLLVLVNESIGQRIPLHGTTISQAESALRSALAATGVDSRRFTLQRHYALPSHPVAGGHAFDVDKPDEFVELAHWYANAASVLGALQRKNSSSEVRCWPHHFDIATLLAVDTGRSVGAGLSPGDESYAEPYFYVNAYPAPRARSAGSLPALEGDGTWNTETWFGAVLPGSRLARTAADQETQVSAFLASAVAACSLLVRQ